MDCIVHGVTKSRTRLSEVHFHLMSPGVPWGNPGMEGRLEIKFSLLQRVHILQMKFIFCFVFYLIEGLILKQNTETH